MAKLSIYLRGVIFDETDIEMPCNYDELSFEENCKIRESYLNYQIELFKIKYTRQILKMEKKYKIFLKIESKIF
jgi:hypothetical protein